MFRKWGDSFIVLICIVKMKSKLIYVVIKYVILFV